MPSIDETLHQRGFESPRQRVLLNVLYTSGWARTLSTHSLRPYGITWQQFNLLRILRGQRGCPASMRLLQDRMLDAQSNASRLVDKLEAKGYVRRDGASDDRRKVGVTLTPEGAVFLDEVSAAIRAMTDGLGGDLSEAEMSLLSNLLDRFRG